MEAVYCEKQENGRILLVVTERTEELLPRSNSYLRPGVGLEKKALQ